MRWSVARPSAVSWTLMTLRSPSSPRFSTSPASSMTTTTRVIVGGCTCSACASSPSVGCPSRLIVERADSWEGEIPVTDSWRSRRLSRVTAIRNLPGRSSSWGASPACSCGRAAAARPDSRSSRMLRLRSVMAHPVYLVFLSNVTWTPGPGVPFWALPVPAAEPRGSGEALVAGDVGALAKGGTLERIDCLCQAARDLGDPRETVLQDPFDAALEGGRADRARAAGTLQLHLDHAGLHVGRNQHEISAVGL